MAMTLYQSQRMIESDQFVFHCVLKDARILICLLQTINLNEDLIVMFTEKGMQFTSEKNKVFQITGYLQRELFDEFTLREESIGLKLPIKLFMDCLTSTLTCSSNFDEQDDKENLVVKKPDTDEPNTSIEICYAGEFGWPLFGHFPFGLSFSFSFGLSFSFSFGLSSGLQFVTHPPVR